MPRYALINPQSGVDRVSTAVDPAVQTKANWKWLQCDSVTPPTFDPTAETVDGPTYTVGASSVTEVWTKRSLTSQEISDRNDTAVSFMNGGGFSPTLKILFNINNRLRTLEGQGALTLAQFKTAIKAAL